MSSPEFNAGFQAGFEAGRKSKILMLARGEYSDYGVLGSFDVMKSFTFEQILTEFKATKDKDEYYDHREFIGWLTQQGYVQQCDTEEVHIGSYGELRVSGEAATKRFDPWAIARLTGS